MPDFTVTLLLWQLLAGFLLIGAVGGVFVSLLLIIKPEFIESISGVANLWVSMRHITLWTNRAISIERWFYRHHVVMGLLISLGAAWMLVYYGLWFNRPVVVESLNEPVRYQEFFDTLVQTAQVFAVVAAALALVLGLVIWLRPSLLRGVENIANHWVTARRATKVLDIPRQVVDPTVLLHAQKIGWILLPASLFLGLFMLYSLL